MVGDIQHPLRNPLVEVVATACVTGLGPEVHVLGVGLGRGEPTEQSARMGAHRALGDRQHLMARDLHQVGPRTDVIDDPFHRGDHPAPGGQRTPDTFEERWVERQIAVAVGLEFVDAPGQVSHLLERRD